MESDFPLLSVTVLSEDATEKRKKKQVHKKYASRKKMRIETLPSNTTQQQLVVTHASSKSCMPSVQLPATVSRRPPVTSSIQTNDQSIKKCVEAKKQMLVDKNVIARGAVLGMLKESLQDPSFFVRVVREEADGVVFEVKDFSKFVVVIMTSIEELCINVQKKGQDMEKILQFLQVVPNVHCLTQFKADTQFKKQVKTSSNMLLPFVDAKNEWRSFKRYVESAQVLPMQIIKMRKKETDTTKISKVSTECLCP